MIPLTKLNKQAIMVNALYIERIEATPDTLVTFTTGKKILVLESVEEVAHKITEYYRTINIFQEMKEGQVDD